MRKRSFRHGRLSEQLVAELESMILEDYPTPGLRLPTEAELAERFSVSRIVVRESMKIMEERGLVEVCAGRGTLTAAPSCDKVKEALKRLFKDQPAPTLEDMELMLELRQILEETVAELAAVRRTPEDLRAMEEALQDMGRTTETNDTIHADLRFHLAVTKAAHNRYFEIVLEPLTQVFLQQIKLTDSYHLGLDLHEHIFDAIRRSNPVAARQAVRRMIRNTRNHTRVALELLAQAVGKSA
ncbi:MAG: FadR family transcriptional regulator [Bryobacteraceae bacterium]|nr:FadR family transcriptional regulator [Bryobacteraceae bacterium]